MRNWGRHTPKHVHRGASKALNLAAGVLLGLGSALGAAKYMQAQEGAPTAQPQPTPVVQTQEIDLTQPHILRIFLDDYGAGMANVALARVEDLRTDMYEDLLAGLPEHLRQQVAMQTNIRGFTDGIVDEYAERLPHLREAFADAIRVGNINESRILCVATGLSESQTLQDLLHNMTGLKMRDAALPLTMPEFRELVATHEYAHCYTPEMNVPVVRETLSDAYALAKHIQNTGDMQVPRLYRDIRMAGLMQHPTASHATGPFLDEFLTKAEQAYVAGELEGLDGADLMEKVQSLVLGAPEQHVQASQEMAHTALVNATAARALREQMVINPYTCRLEEPVDRIVILEEGSAAQHLMEAHQMAVDSICGRTPEQRPTRAQLYEQDLQELLDGQSPEKQAQILTFQRWKIDAVERELGAKDELHRAQARDAYGLRVNERRETLEKVAERANINLQPEPLQQEPSV